ncbi:trimeric LpxA-like protein [Lipomyces tetrasporus]|uniref:Trimeric LpxA-like protein n=1 Tax=Lipomyces tetrasporus TaxID=54092 RepID=A0AAD7QK83_9ASCO|nr:trimeric LpxA-like protein [Lipomyces tetrasporus]KAJ8096751.1 trimeric LpxA-like protein [Lipomyces tetrasporus]
MLDAKPTSFISEHVILEESHASQNVVLRVGDHSMVNPNVRVCTQPAAHSSCNSDEPSLLEIGDYTIVSDSCNFELSPTSRVRIGNYTQIDPGVRVAPGVTIGDCCVLGAGCVIARGTRIGNNCKIAAGAKIGVSVVIPPGSVAVGDAGEVRQAMEDMSDEQRIREMKMHVDFLMRIMPAYNKPRQNRK